MEISKTIIVTILIFMGLLACANTHKNCDMKPDKIEWAAGIKNASIYEYQASNGEMYIIVCNENGGTAIVKM